MATVIERVQKVAVEKLGVEADQVTPEAAFGDDLNADSLDMVEFVLALQDEFGTPDIPDEAAEKILTVQDAVNYFKDELGVKDE